MPAPSGTVTPKALSRTDLAPLEPDWTSPVKFETSWLTAMSKAQESLAEERLGKRWRPLRKISFRHLSRGQQQLNEAVATLVDSETASIPVPIYQDVALLTQNASIAGTVLTVSSTNYRRFQVGQRVVLVEATMNFSPGNVPFEYGIIDSMTATTITLTSGLARDWVANTCLVFPCFDSQISLNHSLTLLTGQVAEANLTFEEIAGDNTLLHSWEGAVGSPAGSFGGYDVFPFPINFNGPRLRILREGKQRQLGVADVVSAYGASPSIDQRHTLQLNNRADFWDVLRFFDAHRGRNRAFFVPSSAIQITTATLSTTQLTCPRLTIAPEAVPYSHVAIKSTTHGLQVVKIDPTSGVGITNNPGGTITTIVFDAALSGGAPSVGNITWTAFCHLSRLSKDTMKESWRTAGSVDVTFEFHELIAEKNVTVANL